MHEYANTNDQYEIIDNVGMNYFHLGEELSRYHIVAVVEFTIMLLAIQFSAIVSVNRHEETVKARTEVRDVEEPTESGWCVHITNAESEYGEEYGYDWTSEYCDLKIER